MGGEASSKLQHPGFDVSSDRAIALSVHIELNHRGWRSREIPSPHTHTCKIITPKLNWGKEIECVDVYVAIKELWCNMWQFSILHTWLVDPRQDIDPDLLQWGPKSYWARHNWNWFMGKNWQSPGRGLCEFLPWRLWSASCFPQCCWVACFGGLRRLSFLAHWFVGLSFSSLFSSGRQGPATNSRCYITHHSSNFFHARDLHNVTDTPQYWAIGQPFHFVQERNVLWKTALLWKHHRGVFVKNSDYGDHLFSLLAQILLVIYASRLVVDSSIGLRYNLPFVIWMQYPYLHPYSDGILQHKLGFTQVNSYHPIH